MSMVNCLVRTDCLKGMQDGLQARQDLPADVREAMTRLNSHDFSALQPLLDFAAGANLTRGNRLELLRGTNFNAELLGKMLDLNGLEGFAPDDISELCQNCPLFIDLVLCGNRQISLTQANQLIKQNTDWRVDFGPFPFSPMMISEEFEIFRLAMLATSNLALPEKDLDRLLMGKKIEGAGIVQVDSTCDSVSPEQLSVKLYEPSLATISTMILCATRPDLILRSNDAFQQAEFKLELLNSAGGIVCSSGATASLLKGISNKFENPTLPWEQRLHLLLRQPDQPVNADHLPQMNDIFCAIACLASFPLELLCRRDKREEFARAAGLEPVDIWGKAIGAELFPLAVWGFKRLVAKASEAGVYMFDREGAFEGLCDLHDEIFLPYL